jgi:membrane protein
LKSINLQENIINYLQGVVDESIINMIIVLFEHIPKINSLSISASVGFLLLLWSASNIFRQLKNFLDTAWDIKPAGSNNIKEIIRDVTVSSVIVLFFGGLLVVSIIIEGLVYMGSVFIQGILPFSPLITDYTSSTVSFLILVLFFVLAYKILPNSSLDFQVYFCRITCNSNSNNNRQICCWTFLAYTNPVSVYGAIGSIIGSFLLIFYSSIMITIGVEFTKVYSES